MGATVTVWDNVTRKGMTFIKDISNNGYVNSVSYMHDANILDIILCIIEAC